MSINRLPIFVWGTLTTSFADAVRAAGADASPASCCTSTAASACTSSTPRAGGHPLLWQHLFWIFGHPWVYIVVLPAMGIVSDAASRRSAAARSSATPSSRWRRSPTGVLGFGVWVHHMFADRPAGRWRCRSSARPASSSPSRARSRSSPGSPRSGPAGRCFRTPFLFAAGFIVLFVIGGVSGVMTAAVPFDRQLTDTYFVVAHLHYVLIGINVFPVIGGFYYWLPKITGRMMSERLGRWNFWTMFVGFNLGFFPMHIAGLLGHAAARSTPIRRAWAGHRQHGHHDRRLRVRRSACCCSWSTSCAACGAARRPAPIRGTRPRSSGRPRRRRRRTTSPSSPTVADRAPLWEGKPAGVGDDAESSGRAASSRSRAASGARPRHLTAERRRPSFCGCREHRSTPLVRRAGADRDLSRLAVRGALARHRRRVEPWLCRSPGGRGPRVAEWEHRALRWRRRPGAVVSRSEASPGWWAMVAP